MERTATHETEILDQLRSRGPALFVTDLRGAITGRRPGPAEFERTLSSLEEDGAVIVRDHYCADPHLQGEDLRVVGLVDGIKSHDPVSHCIEAIDARWSAWLAAYLADHRCG